MVKSTVQVCVRVRPTANFAPELKLDPDSGSVSISTDRRQDKHYVNNQQNQWAFRFPKVLHNATQDAVFQECGQDILTSVMQGYNGRRGRASCWTSPDSRARHHPRVRTDRGGKDLYDGDDQWLVDDIVSHGLQSGGNQSFKYRGLIPRTISELYKTIDSTPETEYKVYIS